MICVVEMVLAVVAVVVVVIVVVVVLIVVDVVPSTSIIITNYLTLNDILTVLLISP